MKDEVDQGPGEQPGAEVELARIQLERDRIRRSFGIIHALSMPASIVSLAAPALAIYPSIRILAGKQTTLAITLTVTVSITVSVIIGGSFFSLLRKIKNARSELQAQRQQITDLERRLGLQGEEEG